jgi:hypothetical protein
MRLRSYLALGCAGIVLTVSVHASHADEPSKRVRAGIIGLDTSHCLQFTKLLNDPKVSGKLAEMAIAAAYPGGSPDIPSCWNRIGDHTKALRGMGVEIVDSIDELLKRVDIVLLESSDGRVHLAQARPVIAAGKPLFIDKPMAASVADAMEIFRLAREKHVPCFSSSSLRFGASVQTVHNGTAGFGDIRRCTAWSSMTLEPHHPDLFWYGVHGVEILYTIMGPGCQTVTRTGPQEVAGVWKDGRKGTFVVRKDFGASVEGTKRSGEVGKFEGYGPLLIQIIKFYKTGRPPVPAEETLEILAFMEAADASKHRGGVPISVESILEKARNRK